MLSSKFNLYNTEWLDLVFANRNQSYGAYELRKNYSGRMTKALIVAVVAFAAIISGLMIYNQFNKGKNIEPTLSSTEDNIIKMTMVELPPLKKTQPIEKPNGGSNSVKKNVKTLRFVAPKVVPAENVKVDIPDMKTVETSTIASVTQDGEPGSGNALSSISGPSGSGTAPNGSGNEGTEEAINVSLTEYQPMFPGGYEAFANYLRKNLRYPGLAAESEIAGRVYLNFIVEKDGSLTDVKVVKGIGYGCDEEAVRVLRKSPKWSAGVQNGRKVRVMFTIPIVFAVGE